jgi:uncharacterized protein with GYD domain
MPIFITQGRFTQQAIKGMLARPEDRQQAVRQLVEQSGGKLLNYYMTFGEYDFLLVSESPTHEGVVPALIAAAAGGGVSDLKTTVAMSSAEMKTAFERAGALAASFRSAGAGG